MNTLVDMISGMEVKEDDPDFMNAVDYMFAGLEKRKPDCFAVKQYRKYRLASGKTARSILISCGARLAPFDIPQLREIMSYDEMELDKLGDCQRQPENVDFRRNGMSFFGGQHSGVYSPYTPLHLPA